jgi:hypothetical protein
MTPGSDVDFCTKIKFGGHLAIRAFWPLGRISAIFFISLPPKTLTGAGLARRISQNLVFKELRYQNLDNERLKLA